MASAIKNGILLGLKYSGAFWLARRLTARGLRILCYHGIAVADEHRFRGRLFMSAETFKARMAQLERLGYPVIALDDAVRGLKSGSLPPAAVVMTFDDAWKQACDEALPWLAKRGVPVTLYVTSYYTARQTQVFNVAIQYLFWATRNTRLDMDELGGTAETNGWDLIRSREQAQTAAIEHCAALPDADARQAFVLRLGDALDVDMRGLQKKGAFMLGSGADLRRLAEQGVDLQLHTHRHTVSRDGRSVLEQEIGENRSFLAPLTSAALTHFCYPSGVYDRDMWPELESLDVASATTCESGFNYRETPPLGLKRILDEEGLSPLEFEAELSGVLELWKRLRAKLR